MLLQGSHTRLSHILSAEMGEVDVEGRRYMETAAENTLPPVEGFSPLERRETNPLPALAASDRLD
jgi:hypothetical protein